MWNATCKLLRPKTTAHAADTLQRDHRFDTLPEQQCSFRALSAVRSIGPLGRVALNGWTCRLCSSEAIKPGWRILVQCEGETEEREFTVAAATQALHWTLTVEGA